MQQLQTGRWACSCQSTPLQSFCLEQFLDTKTGISSHTTTTDLRFCLLIASSIKYSKTDQVKPQQKVLTFNADDEQSCK